MVNCGEKWGKVTKIDEKLEKVGKSREKWGKWLIVGKVGKSREKWGSDEKWRKVVKSKEKLEKVVKRW